MNLFFKILFLSSTSILFFSFTYFGSEHMFTKYDLSLISIIFLIVIILQSIFLILFNKKIYKILSLSFCCSFNIISLHLVFIETIHLLNLYLEILIFVSCFLLMVFICNTCENNIKVLKIFATFPIILLMVFFVINSKFFYSNNEKIAENFEKINKINFNSKPNVYFISFESMVPLSIARRNFKEDGFAYHNTLEENFFKFKNTFTLAFPSKESLNSLLAFNQKSYLLLKKENNHLNFFTGIIESPLFQIFKDNGYEISTFYDNFWFGRTKGKYIDNYFTNEAGGKFNTCAFDPGYGLHYKVSFFGYCMLSDSIKFKIVSFLTQKKLFKTTASEKILEIMNINIKKSKPQLFMAHNVNPGHVGNYKYDDEKSFQEFLKFYKKKSVTANDEIKNILNFIQNKDPNSILFLYSDHGPKLTEGMNFEIDPNYKILDSFAVYAGIHPKDQCNVYAEKLYHNRKFASLIDVTKVLINCLAQDKSALSFDHEQYFMDAPEVNYFNDKNLILSYKNKTLRLENYIYE